MKNAQETNASPAGKKIIKRGATPLAPSPSPRTGKRTQSAYGAKRVIGIELFAGNKGFPTLG